MKKEWKNVEIKELNLSATKNIPTDKVEFDETVYSEDGRVGYSRGKNNSGDVIPIIVHEDGEN